MYYKEGDWESVLLYSVVIPSQSYAKLVEHANDVSIIH